jgi:hypothetical protein
MPKPDATGTRERLQTVGQLKEWLKPFPDHQKLVGKIDGQPGVNLVLGSHAERHVIIEVGRREQRS